MERNCAGHFSPFSVFLNDRIVDAHVHTRPTPTNPTKPRPPLPTHPDRHPRTPSSNRVRARAGARLRSVQAAVAPASQLPGRRGARADGSEAATHATARRSRRPGTPAKPHDVARISARLAGPSKGRSTPKSQLSNNQPREENQTSDPNNPPPAVPSPAPPLFNLPSPPPPFSKKSSGTPVIRHQLFFLHTVNLLLLRN
jgi:hypothetical protein